MPLKPHRPREVRLSTPRLGDARWQHRRMPADDRLQQCSVPVLRDVGATINLHLQVSPWHGRDTDMGYVVHEAGPLPRRPVWETFQLIERGGDAIALHPLPREDPHRLGYGDR
jgi:hypothetical protein